MKKELLFGLLVAPLLLLLVGCGTSTESTSSEQGSLNVSTVKPTNAPLKAVFSPVQQGVCTTGTQFKQGEGVILRIQIIDIKTGQALTNQQLSSVWVLLPNNQVLTAAYGTHQGFMGSTRKFWTAPWQVPSNYPTGQVAYNIVTTGTVGATKLHNAEISVERTQLEVVS